MMLMRLLLFLTIFATTATFAAERPPNIVLIIADDQAWTDFGFMGHPHIETPSLDRLAREGRVFTQGRVPASLCCPSLASIITGRYPFEHGITGNEPPRSADRGRDDAQYQADLTAMVGLIDRSPTLPQLLRQRGYRSFQSGKWWLGSYLRGGFTDGMTHGDPMRGGRHGDDGLKIGRSGMQPIFDFIEQADDHPFLVWYAPMMPHTPHTPPAELLEKYSAKTESIHVARYWAMCEWFDSTCGELLSFLDDSGHADNTLVLFVTDNGWTQRPNASGYGPRSKRSPYDAGVRTPMIIRWPGATNPVRIETPVSCVDIAPTILKACGVSIPPGLRGINLLDDIAIRERGTTFGDVYLHNAVDVRDPGSNLTHRWCVRGKWKLIIPNESSTQAGDSELYNIEDDPHETANLSQLHPALVNELTALTDAWWSGEKRVRPPNILFILTDDQRWDMMGHLSPVLQTPTIDQLAEAGQRFRNAFVTTSICAASRASILTGLVERSHGYTFGRPTLSEKCVSQSYPLLLRQAGYHTGFVGKFGVRVDANATGEMFDSFVPLHPAPYVKTSPDGTRRHLTDITADRAIEYLRERSSNQPFCLSISFNAPHAEDGDPRQYIWPQSMDHLYEGFVVPPPPLSEPAFFASQPAFLRESLNRVRWKWRFDTPEKYQEMVRGYYKMISGVDAALARIVQELENQELADNTVIIFASDNGYFLGDRGFAGKWLPYDASLRVPLIIYDPRLPADKRGRVCSELVLNIDIPCTILDCAQLPRPVQMQGRSLMPLLSEFHDGDWRTDFFCEHLMQHAQIPKHEGVRNERFRYSRYFEEEPIFEELYDLENDPLETKNLVGNDEYEEILNKMRHRCDEMRDEYVREAQLFK